MQTGRVRANTLWHERLWHISYIYIQLIWHKYLDLVSINLMTVPHTDGRHYLRQLDLISLCVTIVTASPFVVWFKVCWKNNDILGQCHLMPLETSWNHMPPWTALTMQPFVRVRRNPKLCTAERLHLLRVQVVQVLAKPVPSAVLAPSALSSWTASTAWTLAEASASRASRAEFKASWPKSHILRQSNINIYDILQHLYKYNII